MRRNGAVVRPADTTAEPNHRNLTGQAEPPPRVRPVHSVQPPLSIHTGGAAPWALSVAAVGEHVLRSCTSAGRNALGHVRDDASPHVRQGCLRRHQASKTRSVNLRNAPLHARPLGGTARGGGGACRRTGSSERLVSGGGGGGSPAAIWLTWLFAQPRLISCYTRDKATGGRTCKPEIKYRVLRGKTGNLCRLISALVQLSTVAFDGTGAECAGVELCHPLSGRACAAPIDSPYLLAREVSEGGGGLGPKSLYTKNGPTRFFQW